MRNAFVETSNYRRFLAGLETIKGRGAGEACLMVLDGAPGLGKTTTLSRWVAQTGSVYIRALQGWDDQWMITDLLAEMSIRAPRLKRERYQKLVAAFGERQMQNQVSGRSFGIVVDECDLISGRREVIETLRGISDSLEVPIILVGMGNLRDNLRRFPQVESRVSSKIQFTPATREDTAALINGLSEVPVAPDLTEYVWRMSRGYNREILEAIGRIERFGRRVDPGDGGITMYDMAGQVLMNDRNTGSPIMMPEGA
ncbi:AAA family ATPase [Oceaniglobus trochenteri]|uniref:AAA family ATPase n=1 Tax=Oceaniglobus trochenteri TaxID=2763260 RepID=UPI001CFF76D7|nr:ATP-binding protein [Oceaniglobus trochenteri]